MLFLSFACTAFAKDPTQPVKRGSVELSAGTSYARITGYYDSTGKYREYRDLDATIYSIPLRIRAGLGKGFEVRADWSYLSGNEDAGSNQGFTQPALSLRYVGKTAGVFTTVTFPFATGDYDNGSLRTRLESGGLLRLKQERFRMSTLASYIHEARRYLAYGEGGILRVWTRPEYAWLKGFSTFVTGDYLQALDEDAYLITLGPGARWDYSEALGVELTSPFSVLGRNSPLAGWSVSLRGLWTLKY